MQDISESDLNHISGGHFDGGPILFILGLPHLIMGIREFTNYIAERTQRGCEYDEDDYFTAFFCKMF